MFGPKPYDLRPPDSPRQTRRSRGVRRKANDSAIEGMTAGLPTYFRSPSRFRGFLRDWGLFLLLAALAGGALGVIFFSSKVRPELVRGSRE